MSEHAAAALTTLAGTVRPDALEGEVTVITGAGRGIGAALAQGLSAFGSAIACVDLNSEAAQQVADQLSSAGGRAAAYTADVADVASCRTVAEQIRSDLGEASVLINSAGVIRRTPTTEEGFGPAVAEQLAVNAVGVANMVEALLPQLRQTRGRIVNLGSIASYLATPGGGGYCASKGAVMQLTKVMAMELAPVGIRVNAIAPGMMVTPFTEAVRSDPQRAEKFLTHTPMARFGEPAELIGAIIFLATPMSSYVTGTTVPVDGGYLTL